jgi:hypothetical protein
MSPEMLPENEDEDDDGGGGEEDDFDHGYCLPRTAGSGATAKAASCIAACGMGKKVK